MKTKVGIIGCGRIANGHMRVYRSIENVEVVVVSDIDKIRARQFANKHGIVNFFTDYVDLLETKDLDFVDICTPTSTHMSIVCNAAKFQHNILEEKPMALSTVECDNIISEVRKNRVKLCICHNQIFYPSIRQAKSKIESGYYNLNSFRTCVKENMGGAPKWNLTSEEKGIIWEVGYHPAYLQLQFLGEIKDVFAVGNKGKYPVYDNFIAVLRTKGQSYGIIEVSWLARIPEIIYEIDSSDGKRALINRVSDSFREKSEKTNKGIISEVKRVLNHLTPSRRPLFTKMQYLIGHYYLIKRYIKSLENNEPSPVKPEEGRNAIKLLECIEESLEKHKVIPFSEI